MNDFSILDFGTEDSAPPEPVDMTPTDATSAIANFIDTSAPSSSPPAPITSPGTTSLVAVSPSSPSMDASNSLLDVFGHVLTAAITTTGAVAVSRNRAATYPTVQRPPVAATRPGILGAPGSSSSLLLPIAGLALLFVLTR